MSLQHPTGLVCTLRTWRDGRYGMHGPDRSLWPSGQRQGRDEGLSHPGPRGQGGHCFTGLYGFATLIPESGTPDFAAASLSLPPVAPAVGKECAELWPKIATSPAHRCFFWYSFICIRSPVFSEVFQNCTPISRRHSNRTQREPQTPRMIKACSLMCTLLLRSTILLV